MATRVYIRLTKGNFDRYTTVVWSLHYVTLHYITLVLRFRSTPAYRSNFRWNVSEIRKAFISWTFFVTRPALVWYSHHVTIYYVLYNGTVILTQWVFISFNGHWS